jgi:glucose-6-phosphate 1-dehydrogenase
MNIKPEPCALVIFGITGDLANRKLIPALYRLLKDGYMPERFVILGCSRQDIAQETLVQMARTSLEKSSEVDAIDESVWQRFSAALEYVQADFTDASSFWRIQRTLERHVLTNHLFYCSVPPSVFPLIVKNLGEVNLNEELTGYARIIIEKPFGTSLQTARELNGLVHSVFQEPQVYRIDHFLGKETVQNMLALRFANTIFEPLWNRNYVDHVQITVAESLGVEGRGGFYEEAGILRDIIQNHAMQLVCLTALEPPVSRRVGDYHPLEADALRDEKVKVIRALKPITDPGEMAVLGQYAAGHLDGQDVPAYRSEIRVSATSNTSTYAAVKLEIENWRWAGVPFYVRSGKRLPRKCTEIAIRFKREPLAMFPSAENPNELVLNIQPTEGISLRFDAKVPGLEPRMRAMELQFNYTDFGASGPTAYERLILDAMLGDASLFPRKDEVEASWAWIQPLLDAQIEPEPYMAGSQGPSGADRLIGTDQDHAWRAL